MNLLTPIEGSADLEQILLPALKPGERLVWCGQPFSWPVAWGTRVVIVMEGGLVGFFAGLRLVAGQELPLWPSALEVGGLVLGFSALAFGLSSLFAAFRRRHTIYGLTADAAIIHQGFPRRRTVLIDLATLAHVDLTLGRQDEGTITFGTGPGAPAFQAVRHARHVFDLVRRKEVADGQ